MATVESMLINELKTPRNLYVSTHIYFKFCLECFTLIYCLYNITYRYILCRVDIIIQPSAQLVKFLHNLCFFFVFSKLCIIYKIIIILYNIKSLLQFNDIYHTNYRYRYILYTYSKTIINIILYIIIIILNYLQIIINYNATKL